MCIISCAILSCTWVSCGAAVSVQFRAGYELLIKLYIPGTRRDGEAEPQSLVSVPNIPDLKPKYRRSAYDVEADLLLIAIRPSDRYVKRGAPGCFWKRVG